ncbi:heme biosynthesis HemY N-terminal domain-containing protein [Gayadomonas joobiniege]|uniref:heme biosynthesis HemY N-terminal domain-containing protein n=1 Tax=Gayadomonas joobiniege TaxID=1234606 RepID=UPI0003757DF0|nr:heme biosynthesis HemY N-terminal domain-containing protein [Gayadomonas joobiniege]
MIKIFILFIVFSCMLGVGSLLVDERGYVLIQVAGWTWEASVIGFLFILLVLYCIYKIVFFILGSILGARKNLSHWRSQKKQKASLNGLQTAIEALFKGNWQRAEKYSLRYVKHSPIAKSHYLVAAEAARKLGHDDEANLYTLRAEENSSEQAKQQAMVKILVQEGKLDKAQRVAEQLYQDNHKDGANLLLLARIYQAQAAFEKLRDILPQVAKYSEISHSELEKIALNAWQPLFNHYAEQNDYKAIKTEYRRINKLLNDEQPATAMYLSALLAAGEPKPVDKHIKNMLSSEQHKNQQTINLIASLPINEPQPLIDWVEKKLQKDPSDHWLKAVLAVLASKAANWELAERAMSDCIEVMPTMENFTLLGDIQSHTGEIEKSRENYRLALDAKESREDKKLIELK